MVGFGTDLEWSHRGPTVAGPVREEGPVDAPPHGASTPVLLGEGSVALPIGMPRSRQSLTNPEAGGPGKSDPHGCSQLASPFMLEQGAVGGLGGILWVLST